LEGPVAEIDRHVRRDPNNDWLAFVLDQLGTSTLGPDYFTGETLHDGNAVNTLSPIVRSVDKAGSR